jgi:hypothetical protein
MISKNAFFKKLRNTPFHFLVAKVLQKTLGKIIDHIRLKNFLKKKKYHMSDEYFYRKLKFRSPKFPLNKKNFFNDYLYNIEGFEKNQNTGIFSNKKEILECADNICDHKIDILDIKNTDVSLKTSFRSKTDKVRSQNQQYPDYLRSKNSIKKIISDLSKTYDDERESEYLFDYDYEPIDWHIDFKSGHRWSKETWYKNIKYGQPGVDIKIPWELSRAHHFLRLGQAYVLTEDEKYTREFIHQLTDWSINNPPESGVNWFCPMEIAIRACNWIVGFRYFKSSRLLNDKIILEFCKNILIAGMHIFNNLEENYSRVKTNHYLSDIVGLLYIGIFFRNSKIGKKWIEFAIRELKKQMNIQVYNDGCDYEASTCYHRLVLELFFYSTLTVIKSSGTYKGDNYIEVGKKIFGEEYIEKLYKMFEVIKFTLKPDGTMPQIGDNDDGRMHIFGTEEVLDMRYLLGIGSIFFKDSKFKIKEFGPRNSASWIFGEKGKAVWDGLQGSNLETIKSTALSNSGWYIMRNKTDYMILSCGPNGQNGNGGHGHNDKLSFELFIDGRNIIIDSGTFTYTADSELRNRFRSTSFHNALIIDKAEQNRFTGGNVFALSDDSKINIEKWKSGEDYDYLSAKLISSNKQDGINYQKRQVCFDKKNGIWLIRDIVGGRGTHDFDLYFHLDKNTECIIEDNMNISILRKKYNNIKIFPVITEGLEVLIGDGEISESYGKITKSKVLKFSKTGRAPAEFIFLISKSDIQNIEEYTKSILKVFNK